MAFIFIYLIFATLLGAWVWTYFTTWSKRDSGDMPLWRWLISDKDDEE